MSNDANDEMPPGYGVEQADNGAFWVTKGGKRLLTVRGRMAGLMAAKIDSAFSSTRTSGGQPLATIKEAPFTWENVPFPSFAWALWPKWASEPEKPRATYLLSFRWKWPLVELSVSKDYAIWRMWLSIRNSRGNDLIRQTAFSVEEWFNFWLKDGLVFRSGDVDFIRMSDVRSEMARLHTAMRAAG